MTDTIYFEGHDPAEINANVERGWREFVFHWQTFLILTREPIAPIGEPDKACEVSDVFFGMTGAGAHFQHAVGTPIEEKKRMWIEESAKHGHVVDVVPHPKITGRYAFTLSASAKERQ